MAHADDAILAKFGFDRATFDRLRAGVRAGTAEAANQISERIEPPSESDIVRLPPRGSPDRAALATKGLDAIARGEVAPIVLAGGMATRFGGTVKACVDVVPGRSFLALKVADAARLAKQVGRPIPLFAMTSFATDELVRSAARALESRDVPIHVFSQNVAMRIDERGEVVRDATGAASLYAPGHGDLPGALRSSGLLAKFLAQGGRTLLMSNVDNVGATLDPAVVGAHLASGVAITAEIVEKVEGDRGGTPARVGGRAQIVEAFRFPRAEDGDAIRTFNTNTFLFDARALDRDFPLSWFVVRKKVDGQTVIQLERLVGELSAHLPTRFLLVERAGPDARFLPVKDPEELAARRESIADVIRSRIDATP